MADARAFLGRIFDGLVQDLRHGVRALRRAPGFSLGAIVILGVGIAANTTMFSAVNAILLQPLAYKDADALVTVLHDGTSPVAPANFLDWRRQSRAFEGMGAAQAWSPNLGAADRTERVRGMRMTADLLPLLGVPPLLGRTFTARADLTGDDDHTVVIGYGFWQRAFSGDANVLGRPLMLDGEPYTIVGVMPRSFAFAPFWVTDAELFAPLPLANRQTDRVGSSLRVFARLAPGVSLAQAQADITGVTARLEQAYPGTNRGVTVTSLKERSVGSTRLALVVLLVAVGFVLLIACANVAHLLLARAAARRREVAVRLALGATRGQIIRQFLVESLLLAGVSGAAGVLLAQWGVRMLVRFTQGDLPRVQEMTLDARVLAFALGVSLVTGLLFGLLPALYAARPDMSDALKSAGRGNTGHRRQSLGRDLLIASEFALALVLLAGAGLMVRSLAALQAIDAGFKPDHVLALEVSVKGSPDAEPGRRAAFFQQALDRVRALPGVRAASGINHLPLAGDVWGLSFAIDGRPRSKPGEAPHAAYRVVLPGYFDTMRLPILRGRDVSTRDADNAARVVVISEHMARKHWPGEDAIGQRISIDDLDTNGQPVWHTVIGVTKNAMQGKWSGDQAEEVYLPYLQNRDYLTGEGGAFTYFTLVLRTDADPAALAPAARAAVWSIDKAVAIANVVTMEAAVDKQLAAPRFQLTLLGGFALVALLLAAAGIYGVMSYAIAGRTKEIGLRMTLGAQRRDVLAMVLGQAMRRVALGAAAGLAGALLLTRLMSNLLYGVRPTDPLTFGLVSLVLVGAALLASYLPARRATRINPVIALRQD
jgi:predicted permease